MKKRKKCSASLAFYLFSPTCLINSIKHEPSCKILYLVNLFSAFEWQVKIGKSAQTSNYFFVKEVLSVFFWFISNECKHEAIKSIDLHKRKWSFFIFQFGDHIFWTDWQTQRIEKADKHFGHNREVIKQFFEGLMDIEIVSPYKQTGK